MLGGFFAGGMWYQKKKSQVQIDQLRQSLQIVIANSEQEKLQSKQVDIINSGNENSCAELPEVLQSNCKENIILAKAAANNDASLCLGIPNEDMKKNCAVKVVFAESIKKDTADSCNTLQDADSVSSCKFNFWNQKAIKDKKIALCDNVDLDMNKQLCRENYSAKK